MRSSAVVASPSCVVAVSVKVSDVVVAVWNSSDPVVVSSVPQVVRSSTVVASPSCVVTVSVVVSDVVVVAVWNSSSDVDEELASSRSMMTVKKSFDVSSK